MYFVLEVEREFRFRFPDDDAANLTTPRLLIDYLTAHLPTAAEFICPSQRVFYRLRSATAARLGCARADLHLDTSLLDLISSENRADRWDAVREDCALAGGAFWPRLAGPGWFDIFRAPRVGTLREATRFVVSHMPGPTGIVQGHGTGWRRSEVAEVVHELIRVNLGLPRDGYTEDSRWAEDLGIY